MPSGHSACINPIDTATSTTTKQTNEVIFDDENRLAVTFSGGSDGISVAEYNAMYYAGLFKEFRDLLALKIMITETHHFRVITEA